MSFPALFTIIVGVGMVSQWSYIYFKHQIPEFETEPIRIKFHIAAEFITALVLIISGIGLLTNQPWQFLIFLIAMGMLLYTVIVSPGYFAQKGQWTFVGMFAFISILAVISLLMVCLQSISAG